MKDVLGQEITVGARVLRGGQLSKGSASAGFACRGLMCVDKLNDQTVTISAPYPFPFKPTVINAKPETLVVVDKLLKEE